MAHRADKLTIAQIINKLRSEGLYVRSPECGNDTVEALTYDSKQAAPGSLFVCKGVHFKDEYFTEAVNRGIGWYMAEKEYPSAARGIIVSDVRAALACAAALFYRYNKDDMDITAFVGTKGKTSSVYFLVNILKTAGRKVAFTTTADVCDGETTEEGFLTTPESPELHAIIGRACDNGCTDMIMEVSSMAAKMGRVHCLSFKYGAFLNITPDHISPFEHKDFAEYLHYKKSILGKCENLAVCIDDSHAAEIISEEKDRRRIITFSVRDSGADVYIESVSKKGFGRRAVLRTPEYELELDIDVPGEYNVANALAAAAVAYMMGIAPADIKAGIAGASIPGRMETFTRCGYTVIADYAHNKASMANAMKALREDYPDKKIVALYGCSGGKVPKRREDMACESGKAASYVYVTADNPNFDDPAVIAGEIKEHLDKMGCPCEIITDRAEAVRRAVYNLKKDEVLLLSGKGREHYQVVRGKITPYEGDAVLAEKYLKEYKNDKSEL